MRRAEATDEEAVLGFASDTWDGWDYLPRAWPVWLAADDGVLLVAAPAGSSVDGSAPTDREGRPLEVGRPLAVARVAMLAPGEAWLEGIRVDPRVRGMDVATDLQVAELHCAAALGASVVRYATSERNEGSHRLGARHGFELLTALRSYSWSAGAGDDEEETGFDEQARAAASEARRQVLQRLAGNGLLASVEDGAAWWERISADRTFAAGARLYEHRAWVLQELTEEAFHRHLGGGEVVVIGSPAAGPPSDVGSPDRSWALAILEREALPAEDVSLHLGLLVGDGGAALRLADAIRQAASAPIRFRLPTDGPLIDGDEQDFAAAGFRPRDWSLHILGRPLDAAHPPPPWQDSASTRLNADPAAYPRRRE